MATQYRVKAVEGRMIPLIDPSGKPLVNAYVGLDRRTRQPMPNGELVTDVGGYYARALEDKDIELMPESAEVSQ